MVRCFFFVVFEVLYGICSGGILILTEIWAQWLSDMDFTAHQHIKAISENAIKDYVQYPWSHKWVKSELRLLCLNIKIFSVCGEVFQWLQHKIVPYKTFLVILKHIIVYQVILKHIRQAGAVACKVVVEAKEKHKVSRQQIINRCLEHKTVIGKWQTFFVIKRDGSGYRVHLSHLLV